MIAHTRDDGKEAPGGVPPPSAPEEGTEKVLGYSVII